MSGIQLGKETQNEDRIVGGINTYVGEDYTGDPASGETSFSSKRALPLATSGMVSAGPYNGQDWTHPERSGCAGWVSVMLSDGRNEMRRDVPLRFLEEA